jgi:hypothetical protein
VVVVLGQGGGGYWKGIFDCLLIHGILENEAVFWMFW